MGEVSVSVTGPYDTMPRQPDADHLDLIRPTDQMALNLSVLMDDGSRWTVVRVPRRVAGGAISVTLQRPGTPVPTTITVPRDDVSTAIWWVGEAMPEPGGEEPGPDQPEEPEQPQDQLSPVSQLVNTPA
jgi:hypothetical protein